MFFQTVDQGDRKLLIDFVVFRDENEPEVWMNSALDAMGAKAEIDIARTAHHGVILRKFKIQMSYFLTIMQSKTHFMYAMLLKTVKSIILR
jgi:hypothetical protein